MIVIGPRKVVDFGNATSHPERRRNKFTETFKIVMGSKMSKFESRSHRRTTWGRSAHVEISKTWKALRQFVWNMVDVPTVFRSPTVFCNP